MFYMLDAGHIRIIPPLKPKVVKTAGKFVAHVVYKLPKVAEELAHHGAYDTENEAYDAAHAAFRAALEACGKRNPFKV